MIEVYRISNTRFIEDITGTGARLAGGRWNHKGRAVLYTSESRALSNSEYLVGLNLTEVPANTSIATIRIPEYSMEQINIEDLPGGWSENPAPTELADIGLEWLDRCENLSLRVPSAVVYRDWNIVINPAHPLFCKVKFISAEPYFFDSRFFS